MYKKHRIEGLSDAIFAIVMTLLVLDLKVPPDAARGHVLQALSADAASWVAFLITFAISARYWMLQHNVFKLTENYTHQAVVLTFIFLGLVSILPFSSALVGRYGGDHVIFALYCLNQAAIGLVLGIKLEYIRLRDHLPPSAELLHLRVRVYTIVMAMLLGALCVSIVNLRYVMLVPAIVLTAGKQIERRSARRFGAA